MRIPFNSNQSVKPAIHVQVPPKLSFLELATPILEGALA